MKQQLEDFETHLREERFRSPRTVRGYLQVVNSFVAFLAQSREEKGVDLENVEEQELTGFLRATSRKAEPSRATWNNRLSALRAFYGFLKRRGRIAMNPALKIERQRVISKEPVPLSFDEMLRLVEAVDEHCAPVYKHRNIAILQVLFHCALRVAEIVSLDLSQLDFDNYIFLDVRRKGGKLLAAAFNDIVAEALQNYLKVRENHLPKGDESALFLSDRKQRISVRAVQEMVKKYAGLAGISRSVSPHLLRHSSATQFMEVGTPLRVVQEICGHASVITTQRYVHVNNGQRRLAVNALGQRWKEQTQRRKEERNAKIDQESPADSASN